MGVASTMEDIEERRSGGISPEYSSSGLVGVVSTGSAPKLAYEHWDKKMPATLGNLIDLIKRGDVKYQLISEQARQNSEGFQKLIENLDKKQKEYEELIPEQARQNGEYKVLFSAIKKRETIMFSLLFALLFSNLALWFFYIQ